MNELVDGPAQDCGLISVGDQLLTIDRQNVETSRIEDLTYLLPGPEGSQVSKMACAAGWRGVSLSGYDVFVWQVVLSFRDASGKVKSVPLVRSMPLQLHATSDQFPRHVDAPSCTRVPAMPSSHTASKTSPIASNSIRSEAFPFPKNGRESAAEHTVSPQHAVAPLLLLFYCERGHYVIAKPASAITRIMTFSSCCYTCCWSCSPGRK